jgi:endonuclease/exonuclease/phosphatase (EEP) superfamily protein YafD
VRVATWNVLHRIHAENWGDAPSLRPFDEGARIAEIAARVARLDADAICLQEVSGDQLALLRGPGVFEFRYPRVPKMRHGPPKCGLADPGEHLVLIARGGGELAGAEAFPDDAGKGFLAVRTGGALVVCTHVTWGDKGPGQLARLAAFVRERPGPALIAGDFNAEAAAVQAALGEGFTVGELAPGMPATRPAGKRQDIDHVIGAGCSPGRLIVEEAGGLSDHNLVLAGADF